MLSIGKVLKPRGLKGEIKILSLITETDSLRNLETVYINKQQYSVKSAKPQPGTRICFLWLDGIDHIDKAENLRDCLIEISTDDAIMEEE